MELKLMGEGINRKKKNGNWRMKLMRGIKSRRLNVSPGEGNKTQKIVKCKCNVG
jgi:hypothetical protein